MVGIDWWKLLVDPLEMREEEDCLVQYHWINLALIFIKKIDHCSFGGGQSSHTPVVTGS